MGNTIMSTPAMRALHSMGYIVDAFAHKDNVVYLDLVAGLPYIRHAYGGHYPRQKYDLGTGMEVLTRFIKKFYTPFLAPGGRTIMPPRHRDHARHETDVDLDPCRELGWGGDVGLPDVVVHKDALSLPDKPRHVVLAPDVKEAPETSEWDAKRWRPERQNWIALSQDVRKAGYVSVAIAKTREQTSWAREGRALDLGGKLSLREAVRLVDGAVGVVAVDNGIAHVAAATQTPVLVIWGPTHVTRSRPLGRGIVRIVPPTAPCAPCFLGPRWKLCGDIRCVKQSVEQVFGEFLSMMEDAA